MSSHIPDSSSEPNNKSNRSKHRPRWKDVVAIGTLTGVLGLTLFSVYVAWHEPDPQETVILGQTKLAARSPAGIRILVRRRNGGSPIHAANVHLFLENKDGAKSDLGLFQTGPDGSVGGEIAMPDVPAGRYLLNIEVRSRVGKDSIRRAVEIIDPARVLLACDKPVYQPGQIVRMRAIVSNRRTQKPIESNVVVFEVSDSRGNKVFKKVVTSSAYGIASADFSLADELKLGRYSIKAMAGAAEAERAVEVKRYVLPTFKLTMKTDQTYYRPGQTIAGKLTANYFFGKPVINGKVHLNVETLHEAPVTVAQLDGITDVAGEYPFHIDLPEFFAGQGIKNGQAFLDLTAEVTDAAGHTDRKTASLSVSTNDLEVAAIPEGDSLVPGVENLIYVLAAYPDGLPAECEIRFNSLAYATDKSGVCVAKFTPVYTNFPVIITARDSKGRTGRASVSVDPAGQPPLLVRTDRAVYQAGEEIQITAFTGEEADTVFVDLIHEGQTVLTKSIAVNKQRGVLAIPVPPGIAGTLKINAYRITESGEDRGQSRLVFIRPAGDLRISAVLDKPVHRPGESATLKFEVTDSKGKPSPAALGISIVDESVLAMEENRPGLLQQFLEVERDLLKPRFQVKFFENPARIFSKAPIDQNMASAYLASISDRHSGSKLDEYLRAGYITPATLERVRNNKGSFDPELRKQYGDIIGLIDGEGTDYPLRDFTGPSKKAEVERSRKSYFAKLKAAGAAAVGSLVFVLPILLLVRVCKRAAACPEIGNIPMSDADRAVLTTVMTVQKVLARLTLLPIFIYPLGAFLLGPVHGEGGLGGILAIEVLIVVACLVWVSSRIAIAQQAGHPGDLKASMTSVLLFGAQFVASRIGVCTDSGNAFWWLFLIIAPWIVLAFSALDVRAHFGAKGITPGEIAASPLDILLVFAFIFILSGMLLPALAKARATSSRVRAMVDLKEIEMAGKLFAEDNPTKITPEPGPPVRVRREFPETLLWQPELITDDSGRATLEVPAADSITTWHASVDAIDKSGRLGGNEVKLPVFQDFFIDLDLPVYLTLGDEVTIPVACHNYLDRKQAIQVKLEDGDWFTITGGFREQSAVLGPNEVKSLRFPVRVTRVGRRRFIARAQSDSTSDAVEREIRIVPSGKFQETLVNGILRDKADCLFSIPDNAIPESGVLVAKMYPSRFSEIVEGLEGVFRAPYGCFEQTSSVTYPNVLALDYLKSMGRLKPETEIKARKLINTGYQRLLSFEVSGGGFEWFGRSPANVCLTAYGVAEFTDMARVHSVDGNVINRAVKWLAGKQNSDGSWDEIGHRGWTWSGRGSITAFVAWALAESGQGSGSLDRALDYLRQNPADLNTIYARALAANAFVARNPNDDFGKAMVSGLADSAVRCGHLGKRWESQGSSITFSGGESLTVETTALAVMALIKEGAHPQLVKEALVWISSMKNADGTWGSTQATILAMRALIQGSRAALGQSFTSHISIFLDGREIKSFQVDKENSEVVQLVGITPHLHPGDNRIEIRQSPSGELPFQIAGGYWTREPAPTGVNSAVMGSGAKRPAEALRIDQQYDRATLAVNDLLKCRVVAENLTDGVFPMVMIDLGIPPGFEPERSEFQAMVDNGEIAKFEISGTQISLYLIELAGRAPFKFQYSLRAKYPLRVQTPRASVYEYYTPANRAISQSVWLTAQ